MSLAPGTRLGPFEIVSQLGAGGMGEVYRARDARLDRDVAVKVLPPLFADDPERRARFSREAQLLAVLNHPHVAQVYGVEDSGGSLALVMELVDGDTLDALIARGPLPIAEALPIAREIAEALEAAHERGIVHRDLKPANVKLSHAGGVKVLDFGLAKAIDAPGPMSDLANSPTFVGAATQLGTILGTAAYMSPEQARGKTVDKRSDIWAFGCVLFEMLAGRRPFDGESITDVLGAIVHKSPDFSLLPSDTPPAVRALLARCLEKDATRRLRDIGEARVALDPSSGVSMVGAPLPATLPPVFSRRRINAGWIALAALGGLTIGGAAAWRLRPAAATATPLHLNLSLPANLHMTRPPAISRDGRTIAYTAEPLDGSAPPVVYVRALDGFEAKPVAGSAGATEPFFSPDGKFVGFFTDGWLSRAPVAGGTPQPIVPTENLTGATWLDDGTIVFSRGLASPLWRVRADGGTPQTVTVLDKARRDYTHVYPQWLGGDRVKYTVWTGADNSIDCVVALAAKSNDCTALPRGALRYLASGHFLNEGSHPDVGIVAAPASLASFKPDFEPLLQNVFWFINQDRSFLSVSDTGTLVYVAGNPSHQSIAWVAADGTTTPVRLDHGTYGRIMPSPDGTRAAFGGEGELFVLDLTRGTTTRVASGGNNLHPSWAPDGRHLYFVSNRDERWALYVTAEEDQWAPRPILKRPNSVQMPSAAPDGTIAFAETHPGLGRDIMLRAPDGSVTTLVSERGIAAVPVFSPDGKFVAYVTNAANARAEVFVKPRQGGAALRVSAHGGDFPSWSPRGDTIYFMQGSTVMAASIDSGGRPGAPRVAIANAPVIRTGVAPSADGRFLAIVLQPDAIARDVRVVTNFFDEIRRAAAAR